MSESIGPMGARPGARWADAGTIAGEGMIPAERGRPGEARLGARHRDEGGGGDDERRRLGARPARGLGLAGEGRPRPQGQRRRPACLQDRQGRRQGAGGSLPPRPGPRALGAVPGGPGPARAPSPPHAPGEDPDRGAEPDLRPAHPVRTAGLLRAGFEGRTRSSSWRAAGCPRSGEPRSPSCSSWRRRWTAESTRSTASSLRSRAQTSASALLATMPGIGPLLGLTFAAEIGEVSRFRSPGKLIGYAGLAPRVSQSGERSATGALSKAGSRTLRWAAVEAANQAWRPANPWHGHYLRVSARHGKNPAKSSVARKLLIAAWHMLSRDEPFKPPAPTAARTLPRRAPAAF